MTRRFLRRVCRALIGVVLLAQMAVAAYACPGLLPGTAMKMPTASAASAADGSSQGLAAHAAAQGGPCADMAGPMDPDFGNLCAEHCHHDQQGDRAAALAVPAVWLTALYTAAPPTAAAFAPRSAGGPGSALAAAPAPLAILHCCFRI